jgi:hypothetical protein
MSFASRSESNPSLFSEWGPEAPAPQPMARARRRTGQWQQNLAREASYASRRARSEAERERVWQAYEEELERGPDFTRYHGESDFTEPPVIALDRNEMARLRFQLIGLYNNSWAKKAKGKHAGLIQHSTIRVFDALCSLAKKHGRVFPSQEGLAQLAKCSKNTVIAALKELALFGFITVYRRIKRVPTLLGYRVEQDTNAYSIQKPNSFGEMALRLFGFVTESTNWKASNSNSSFDRTKGRNSPSHPPKTDPWRALQEVWDAT